MNGANDPTARPSAEPGADAALREEVERLTIGEAQYRDRCTDLARELAAAEARADAAERVTEQLRADLANAASGMAEHTCEGCGAALMVDEDAATTTDVVGCWPYVTGEDAHGKCWRYRTSVGMDRAWPACALAAQTAGPAREGEPPLSHRSVASDLGLQPSEHEHD